MRGKKSTFLYFPPEKTLRNILRFIYILRRAETPLPTKGITKVLPTYILIEAHYKVRCNDFSTLLRDKAYLRKFNDRIKRLMIIFHSQLFCSNLSLYI